MKFDLSMYEQGHAENGNTLHGDTSEWLLPAVGDIVKGTNCRGRVIERKLAYLPGPALKIILVLERTDDDGNPIP